jgi:hypothetical protein
MEIPGALQARQKAILDTTVPYRNALRADRIASALRLAIAAILARKKNDASNLGSSVEALSPRPSCDFGAKLLKALFRLDQGEFNMEH